MLMAIKMFLGTDTGKMLIFVVVLGAAIGSAFVAGNSRGRTVGYTEGFKAGQDSKAEEIQALVTDRAALTKIINDEREAQAEKVKEVERQASEATIKTTDKLNAKLRERDAIIANYNRVVPISVQEQCGLAVETVRAINQLIDSINGGQNEIPGTKDSDVRAGGQQPNSPGSIPADGMRSEPEAQTSRGRGAESKDGDSQRADKTTAGVPTVAKVGGTPSD